jgi:hypothetical protein
VSGHTVIDGIDYGPLAALVGTWKGDKGVDLAPEPDGDERNPYYETIVFELAEDVDNAEEQNLAIARYHQVVSRKSNDKVFHDQVGYWLWDSSSNGIVETFVIPRGVGVVAEGTLASPDDLTKELVFEVSADGSSGITQSQFMLKKARTTGFTHTLTVTGDEMRYKQTTLLDIYGKESYEHTDMNTLQRVG